MAGGYKVKLLQPHGGFIQGESARIQGIVKAGHERIAGEFGEAGCVSVGKCLAGFFEVVFVYVPNAQVAGGGFVGGTGGDPHMPVFCIPGDGACMRLAFQDDGLDVFVGAPVEHVDHGVVLVFVAVGGNEQILIREAEALGDHFQTGVRVLVVVQGQRPFQAGNDISALAGGIFIGLQSRFQHFPFGNVGDKLVEVGVAGRGRIRGSQNKRNPGSHDEGWPGDTVDAKQDHAQNGYGFAFHFSNRTSKVYSVSRSFMSWMTASFASVSAWAMTPSFSISFSIFSFCPVMKA